MIPFAIKSVRPLAAALMLFLAATHAVLGQERELAGYNCAITPPNGWQMMTNLPPRPGLVTLFAKADKTALLFLLIDDHNEVSGPLDDRFVSEFERGVEDAGAGKRVSGKFIEVAGIKSYERLGNVSANGKRASTIMQAVPTEGRIYSLLAMRFDGDASEDREIRKALASFRFIKAPAVPSQLSSSRSAAYRIGYTIGNATGIALLIAAALAVVKAIKSRKAKLHRATPPPLPPSR